MEHFSLPDEFLSFEDTLMDNNFKKQANTKEFIFPSEFPYDFNQNANVRAPFNHSLHPIASHNNYEKSGMVLGGSQQSKVELIHQAGGGIAKMKMKGVDALLSDSRKLLHQQHHSQMPPNNSSAFYNAFQQERCMYSNNHVKKSWNVEKQRKMGGSSIGLHRPNEQVAWLYMRQHNQEKRAICEGSLMNGGSRNQFSCGGGVKKQSSGTGVFLPRSYGTSNHINTNKSNYLATPTLDRGALGRDRTFNVLHSGVVQPPSQTRFVDRCTIDKDEVAFHAKKTTYPAWKFPTARDLLDHSSGPQRLGDNGPFRSRGRNRKKEEM